MYTLYQKACRRKRIISEAKKTGNITATARNHGIRRETIHKWMKRYDRSIESLKDRSKRPKYHPNQHTAAEVEKIKRVQGHHKEWGMIFLWVILTQEHGYTRSVSGLYKVLDREKLIIKRQKKKRYKAKLYDGKGIKIDGKTAKEVLKEIDSGSYDDKLKEGA